MQSSNALLDVDTMEVICQECGNAITNVSLAMKRTLKGFGCIIRDNQNKAFMMACKECNANREVVLDQEDNTVCAICHNGINVHSAMKLAITQVGRRIEAQVEKKSVKKKKAGRKKVK